MRNSQGFMCIKYAFCALVITSCSVVKKQNKLNNLIIINPTAIERADELIVLKRGIIEQKVGSLAINEFIAVTGPDSSALPIQFDDVDKDGKWDEAVFLYTFKPSETAQFQLSKTTNNSYSIDARAHVRMRKKNTDNSFGPLLDSVTVPGQTAPTDFNKQKLPPYLTEGPAWENDKVAFRIYMDTRNTKDIFGKRIPAMMMDTVGVNPANIYHNLAPWGMDILAVGKSLGAGSLALSIPTANGRDTLVRLGGQNIEQITFEKVADGPIRAIFRMHYKNWQVTNTASRVNVTEEISISAGKYYYQSAVTVMNAPAEAKLVTGIVNLKSKKSNELAVKGAKALFTYDLQSENKDLLGLAVIAKNNQSPLFGTTSNTGSEVLNTYTVTMPITNAPTEFRFVSGWEKSDLLFTRQESFQKYLENEALKYGNSVIIKL
jgi:hypothetical protein